MSSLRALFTAFRARLIEVPQFDRSIIICLDRDAHYEHTPKLLSYVIPIIPTVATTHIPDALPPVQHRLSASEHPGHLLPQGVDNGQAEQQNPVDRRGDILPRDRSLGSTRPLRVGL
jgi:hypothetical protein